MFHFVWNVWRETVKIYPPYRLSFEYISGRGCALNKVFVGCSNAKWAISVYIFCVSQDFRTYFGGCKRILIVFKIMLKITLCLKMPWIHFTYIQIYGIFLFELIFCFKPKEHSTIFLQFFFSSSFFVFVSMESSMSPLFTGTMHSAELKNQLSLYSNYVVLFSN